MRVHYPGLDPLSVQSDFVNVEEVGMTIRSRACVTLMAIFSMVTVSGAGVPDPDAAPFPEPAGPFMPETYLCHRATDTVTIDGRLDERDWQAAATTDPFLDIVGGTGKTPRHETLARMLWDDDYFYVAAEMVEDHLWATLTERDAVIYFDVPDEAIVGRLSGRRVCRGCGDTYHVDHLKPQVEGQCDECGGELYQRDDDRPETVLNRLRVYKDQTADLLDYYEQQGLLVRIDGDQSIEKVGEAVRAAMAGAC